MSRKWWCKYVFIVRWINFAQYFSIKGSTIISSRKKFYLKHILFSNQIQNGSGNLQNWTPFNNNNNQKWNWNQNLPLNQNHAYFLKLFDFILNLFRLMVTWKLNQWSREDSENHISPPYQLFWVTLLLKTLENRTLSIILTMIIENTSLVNL